MNKKINNILNDLYSKIRSLEINDTSIIITGSVARREEKLDDKNNFISDLDVLVIVKNYSAINRVKDKLNKIEFDDNIVFIFTIVDKIKESNYRGYKKDLSSNLTIIDNLDIEKKICIDTSDIKIKEGLLQEICYYYSKYELNPTRRIKNKIVKKIYLLEKYSKKRISSNSDIPTIEDIVKFIQLENVQILASSLFFLQNISLDRTVLFEEVRNLVFLENQGIPFKESIL